jgi:dihydroxy-acid dehydratase
VNNGKIPANYVSRHVAPEAAVGGAIALVREGGSITIDAERLLLQLNVPDEELTQRRAAWQLPTQRHTSGVMVKYAKLVSAVGRGAVTDG